MLSSRKMGRDLVSFRAFPAFNEKLKGDRHRSIARWAGLADYGFRYVSKNAMVRFMAVVK